MRLNLGSGPRATPGWICIDRSPSILLGRIPLLKRLLFGLRLITREQAAPWDRGIYIHDIRKLPFRDVSVDVVYSSHALEHVYVREAQQVLRETYRVLKPGGIIRLALPDGESIARDLILATEAGDPDAGKRYNERLLTFPERRPDMSMKIRSALGGHVHRWQPTRSHVRQLMQDAGFRSVVERQYRVGEMPGLAEIETRPSSFFFEGTKG